MKFKEIRRTSTFAWSPATSLPLLATGTVAGALDESFSNESQLEIWAPDFLDEDEFELGADPTKGPMGLVTDTSRFNRLAWGYVDPTRPRGVIAAGLENGELALWDPSKILSGQGSHSLILRNSTHTGPVRGLDFNPIQASLLASGAVSGEVYVWDLKDPSKPYTPTPGSRSTKLDEITSVAWNQQVQYVLAGSSSTGYTVVWDLRGKREVVALAYGGGAGTLAGQVAIGGGLAVGGRRGMSDIAWHPDNATRLVTASEDDSSPIIMVWDLRNARAPEKILTGHDKGILSLSWCKQDADLLLSCGKDNRALCWNPQTSEIIGELPSHDNWAFQVDWCPRNPDLFATAFFDGTIGIHSIQSTNEPSTTLRQTTETGTDVFDISGFTQPSRGAALSLKQSPSWLRRPVSNSFAFNGKLITVSNLANAQGKNQSSTIHIHRVVTEKNLVERARKLRDAMDKESLYSFAEEKTVTSTANSEGWRTLFNLFNAKSRDELVTLLGFSKSEVAARVAEAIENVQLAKHSEEEVSQQRTHEPVVSFAEPERQADGDGDDGVGEKTPSEISASVTSDAASGLRADGESTTTVPSLFGDDTGPGTPQLDTGADFFNTVGVSQPDSVSPNIHVPHTNYGLDSSVAATVGSGPSSVISEILKDNSFKIYPPDESETDRLVTKALLLGDFQSAVSLCLTSDRYADAILLAVRGGPELFQLVQKAYFERRTTTLPYLRLFHSIVTNDLADIVQNAEIQEWQEIFIIICTFASPDEFPSLAEQLGARLEFQSTLAKSSEDPDVRIRAGVFRRNATLIYLASARLERLVSIWVDELLEEEQSLARDGNGEAGSPYSARACALQSFMEKVAIFRSATKYEDNQLASTSILETEEATAKTYKLTILYELYFEYAGFLSNQGLVNEASAFVKLIPMDYKGLNNADHTVERQRILTATNADIIGSTAHVPAAPIAASVAPAAPQSRVQAIHGYPPVPAPPVPAPPVPVTSTPSYSYQPTAAVPGPYVTPPTNVSAPPIPAPGPYTTSTYAPVASLTQPPHLRAPHTTVVPPPPQRSNGTQVAPPPPPKRQDNTGWNDAPIVSSSRVATNATPPMASKPNAITSPFPNALVSPTGSPYMGQGQASLPPPPKPGSQGTIPPPPSTSHHGQSGLSQAGMPLQTRPPSTSLGLPPSARMSPALSGQPPRLPTPSQYAPPPVAHGSITGPNPPLPQLTRLPPPGQGTYTRTMPSQPSNPGPYAPPPPSQVDSGPYAPPTRVSMAPPLSGSYALPPGTHTQPPPAGISGPPRASGLPAAASPAPTRAQPPPPKYPPGDRSHIPDDVNPVYQVLSEHLERLKQMMPPQQRRVAEDLDRRLNVLFDALNCETLSKPVVELLIPLTQSMAARDRPAALAIHVDLVTRGTSMDNITTWMPAIKQMIMKL